MSRLVAGIDPGVKTGVAIWDCEKKKFTLVESMSIVRAMAFLEPQLGAHGDIDLIRFEDARKRQWFGKSGREVLQGAGSVKRDCKIWQEFCEYYGIKFEAVAPAKGQTKWNAERFKHITKWTGRTNEHSRDAAVLVFGEQ